MKKFKSENNLHMAMVVDVLRTAEILNKKISTVLKEKDITHAQFNVLRILQGARPKAITSSTIRQRLVFAGTDLSRMIDRMVNNGLVDRSPNKTNRRKLDLHLSKEGLAVLKYVLPRIEKTLDGFYKDQVTAKEMDITRKVLDRIQNS